jgi:hypothetical protein
MQLTINILTIAEKSFTVLAIIVGGLWAYYNYFKGRIYRTRIEPRILGEVCVTDGITYLTVNIQLKNAGVSKVDLQARGSGFRVYAYKMREEVSKTKFVEWNRLATFPIFSDHGWIESGETIVEEHLVEIPGDDHLALMLELRAVAHKVAFKSRSVVTISEKHLSLAKIG